MANFDIGDRIKHKVFGEGDVLDVNGVENSAKLTILFDDIDDKKVIMASFVKLLK
jgi:DNA helicase-2/ATP-dependent DNA helicase PcrA